MNDHGGRIEAQLELQHDPELMAWLLVPLLLLPPVLLLLPFLPPPFLL
jgi:hypothetical protein